VSCRFALVEIHDFDQAMFPGPDISVIVPHLNQPESLAKCLDSLARQRYSREHFEVIVVDNGSDPLPEDVVGGHVGVSLLQEATPGPGPARNRGVAASTGEILAFIDADCIADADWLATIAEGLKDPNACRILGGDVLVAAKYAERLTTVEAYESVFAFRQREYIEIMGFSGGGNLAVRRSDFESVGPFAGIEVAEDRDWGRRACAFGFELEFVPGMVVWHPARRSLAELFVKWDRQIIHDYQAHRAGGSGNASWAIRALAVLLSPPIDSWKVLRSTRLAGLRNRLKALPPLVIIRTYRAWRMVGLASSFGRLETRPRWNDESDLGAKKEDT
jgi:glycosyltransferase involved in cell wall biosynthesis